MNFHGDVYTRSHRARGALWFVPSSFCGCDRGTPTSVRRRHPGRAIHDLSTPQSADDRADRSSTHRRSGCLRGTREPPLTPPTIHGSGGLVPKMLGSKHLLKPPIHGTCIDDPLFVAGPSAAVPRHRPVYHALSPVMKQVGRPGCSTAPRRFQLVHWNPTKGLPLPVNHLDLQ